MCEIGGRVKKNLSKRSALAEADGGGIFQGTIIDLLQQERQEYMEILDLLFQIQYKILEIRESKYWIKLY